MQMGFSKKPGSYGETFAPTPKFSVIRTICAIAAQENLTLYQLDVKGAFLLAPHKEPVYIRDDVKLAQLVRSETM